MASSTVEVANVALTLVGVDAITSLADASKPARVMNRIFEQTKRGLLSNYGWKFATKMAELALVAGTPEFDWAYAHQLPTDYIQVMKTDLGSDELWEIQSDKLYADSTPVKIKYTYNHTDVGHWSEGFCSALSHKLAWMTAYTLTQSSTLADRLGKEFLIVLRDARSRESQGAGTQQVEANEWLNSRF